MCSRETATCQRTRRKCHRRSLKKQASGNIPSGGLASALEEAQIQIQLLETEILAHKRAGLEAQQRIERFETQDGCREVEAREKIKLLEEQVAAPETPPLVTAMIKGNIL